MELEKVKEKWIEYRDTTLLDRNEHIINLEVNEKRQGFKYLMHEYVPGLEFFKEAWVSESFFNSNTQTHTFEARITLSTEKHTIMFKITPNNIKHYGYYAEEGIYWHEQNFLFSFDLLHLNYLIVDFLVSLE